MITCDDIINAADSISTNMTKITNTISTKVMSSLSINCYDEKARYKIVCYILYIILLVIILLLIIAIIYYHYTKQKLIGALTI